MHPTFKRKLVIIVAALAVVAFAGGAFAATQNKPVSVRQAFLNDVAKRLNVTPEKLTSAIRGAYLDELSTAVAQHRLTQSQANAIKRGFLQGGAVPFGGLVAPLPLAAMAPAPMGPRAVAPPFLIPKAAIAGGRPLLALPRPAIAAAPFPFVFGGLKATVGYLGMKTPMQLLSMLGSGKSLAQIAQARGKSVTGLESAIIASERTMLDRLVANKVITSAREQKLLARLSKRVDKLVNRRGFPVLLPRRFAPTGVAPGKLPRPALPVPVLPLGP